MRMLAGFAALLAMLAGGFFFVVPRVVGARMNPTLARPPYQASERARALHRTLRVADLHADSLLWGRDLLARGSWGHVDVPRLIEGRVALQAFTVVTKTPRGMNIEHNRADSDNITLLALAERWPRATWHNLLERAVYQAGELDGYAAASGGRLTVIRTAADLDAYLARRQAHADITAGFLGVEGAHALEGRVANLERLIGAGVRMLSLTHFFDNDMAGSAHGIAKGGLTAAGRALVSRMEARHVLVDLAHASPGTIDDVLAMATRPVVVSHTGVKGTCDNTRNLTDGQVRSIAATGGVIGIGFWDTAVCGTDAKAVARAIKYAVGVAGVDHVALGSDYDGAVAEPFDASGLVLITEALLQEGFTGPDIRKVMGENTIQLLRRVLP